MSLNPLNLLENKPTRVKHSICAEDDFYLHYRRDLPGELEAPQGLTHHLITFFLTENKRQITHFEHHGEYDGSSVCRNDTQKLSAATISKST